MADIRDFTEAEDAVEDMTDTLYSKAETMKHTAKDLKKQAYHAGTQLRKWADRALDQAEDARHKIEDGIRERPFLSSFALFTAGLLTARMMARK